MRYGPAAAASSEKNLARPRPDRELMTIDGRQSRNSNHGTTSGGKPAAANSQGGGGAVPESAARRAPCAAVPCRSRRRFVRGPRAAARTDGSWRLPQRSSPSPGRGRRVPGRISGAGPESAYHSQAPVAQQLAARRGLSAGTEGQGATATTAIPRTADCDPATDQHGKRHHGARAGRHSARRVATLARGVSGAPAAVVLGRKNTRRGGRSAWHDSEHVQEAPGTGPQSAGRTAGAAWNCPLGGAACHAIFRKRSQGGHFQCFDSQHRSGGRGFCCGKPSHRGPKELFEP